MNIKPKLFLLAGLFAFAAAIGAAAVLWLFSPTGNPSHTEVFEVSPGQALSTVAKGLEKKGLIRNAKAFVGFVKLTGKEKSVRVGEYQLARGLWPNEILATLSSGKSLEKPITFPEGLSIYEISEMVEAKGLGSAKEFLRLVKDPVFVLEQLGEKQHSLEGYLFPETYMVTKYTKERQLISMMVSRFKEVFSKEVSPLIGANEALTKHQVVTLASIIEKETGAPEERPIISSVIHNRLKKKIRLDMDSTIIYGIADKTGTIVKNIRRKDIKAYTRYNTYRVPALPYGPIANPGKDSLKAVLQPATTNYLYFVSRNDGTHVFTENYKDHQKAVREWQLNRKNREGRSWRDRNKKANKR